MNFHATSKTSILKASKEIVRTKGWEKLSIRAVASECGISVGTVYNYYDSKSKLMEATAQSIWAEIFHRPKEQPPYQDICTCITNIYKQMEAGCKKYPDCFFLHPSGFNHKEIESAREIMKETWIEILSELSSILQRDKKVRKDAFTGGLTKEMFADFLFCQTLAALLRQNYDPTAVLKITKRTLY